jgi:hypothetical protein
VVPELSDDILFVRAKCAAVGEFEAAFLKTGRNFQISPNF